MVVAPGTGMARTELRLKAPEAVARPMMEGVMLVPPDDACFAKRTWLVRRLLMSSGAAVYEAAFFGTISPTELFRT